MKKKTNKHQKTSHGRQSRAAEPAIGMDAHVVQEYGRSVHLPVGLSEKVRDKSIELLNQALADTMTLRDLYKKHHWQVAGRTFYPLHLLFDKHFEEQAEVVDTIAERIQLLGGISVAMAADVAELTTIERPPKGREEVPVQIARLLKAHETILNFARRASKIAEDNNDIGTTDLFVSDVLRLGELQSWFLSEHLVDLPLILPRKKNSGKARAA